MDSSTTWQPSVPAFFSNTVQSVKEFFDDCVQDTATFYMPCGGMGSVVGYEGQQQYQAYNNRAAFISMFGATILDNLSTHFASQASSLSERSIFQNPKVTYGLMGLASPGALVLRLSLDGLGLALGEALKENYVYAAAKFAISMMGLYSFQRIQQIDFTVKVLGTDRTFTSLSNYIMKNWKCLEDKFHYFALKIGDQYFYWPKCFVDSNEGNIKKLSQHMHHLRSLRDGSYKGAFNVSSSYGYKLKAGQSIILANERTLSGFSGYQTSSYQSCLFNTGKCFPDSRDRLGYDPAHQSSHSQYVRLVCNDEGEVTHFIRLPNNEKNLTLIKRQILHTDDI